MTVFWVVAALLIVAALLFVLPPLLRKEESSKHVSHKALNIKIYQDQKAELELDLTNKIISDDQYEQSIQEMERRLLDDVDADLETPEVVASGGVSRAISIFVAIVIPLAAIFIYQELGNPAAITGEVPVIAANGSDDTQGKHVDTGVQVEEMITQLAERLKADPSDMEGWLMLARSLRFQKHYAEAVKAFEQAMPVVQNNAQLLADYADTLAMANNGMLAGKPIALIKQALQLDPNHIQGLWLAGTYEYDTGNYAEALRYWQQLHSLFPADSKDDLSMANNIAEVKARLNSEGAPVPSPQAPSSMGVNSAAESQKVVELTARVTANPDDAESWLALARTLHSLQRFAEAAAAFEKGMPVVQKNAQALSEYADTLAMANNGALEGKPMELIKQALALDPNHIQSLWLAGTYEFDTENYGEALRYWQQLHSILPPDSQDAQAIATSIAEIQAKLNGTGAASPAQGVSSSSAAQAKVGGTIKLDASLQDQVTDTDTVFIFARAASGPKMPLAILRKQVSDLPVTFFLDQSMAMMPSMSLSNFQKIIVGARITKTGNAMPQSGDLQGLSSVINVGTSGLEINIDSIIP